jgi:hypothetical protein
MGGEADGRAEGVVMVAGSIPGSRSRCTCRSRWLRANSPVRFVSRIFWAPTTTADEIGAVRCARCLAWVSPGDFSNSVG